jgi:hypothetical protein
MSPELLVAVEQVTWEKGMADGWFNDTSKDYYAPKPGQTVPGPQFSNLHIELPSKDYLLCLKIMSGRPEEKANDPMDVEFMVKHMPNIKSEKDWQEMYVKFFGKNDWKPYTAEAARRAIEAKTGRKLSFSPGVSASANRFAVQYKGQEWPQNDYYKLAKEFTSDWKAMVKYLDEAGLVQIENGWAKVITREEIGDRKFSSLKTEKGTPIKRSRLGVGKDIGGAIYLHRDYKNLLPDQAGLVKAAKVAFDNGMQDYNVIKASKDGTYTFIKSLDFDTADEPTVGAYLTVKPDGSSKRGNSNAIWHHKWLWVTDDYTGFNVEESKERSRKWLALPGIDFNRIGNKDYWDANVVPKIAAPIMYHGTDADFDKLDPEYGQLGIHVGDPEQAGSANGQGEKPKNMWELQVEPVNKVRLPDLFWWEPHIVWWHLTDAGVLKDNGILDKMNADWEAIGWDETNVPLQRKWYGYIRKCLLKKGIDGIVYLNRHEGLSTEDKKEVEGLTSDEIKKFSDEEFSEMCPSARDSFILFTPQGKLVDKKASSDIPSFQKMCEIYEGEVTEEDEGRYNYHIKAVNNLQFPLVVYRHMFVKDKESIRLEGSGRFWATNAELAFSHNGPEDDSHDQGYMLRAIVQKDQVDWEDTLFARIVYGEDEDEISIAPGTTIKLTGIKVDEGQWEVEDRHITAKTAKAPYKLQEFEGFHILIGRSAIENDILSLKVANPQDFWFHVARVPGSHIVVRNPDNLKELPGPVLQQVKQLAIHNSKARGTSAEVHWGLAKDVSKPQGAADGEVNLANWKKV